MKSHIEMGKPKILESYCQLIGQYWARQISHLQYGIKKLISSLSKDTWRVMGVFLNDTCYGVFKTGNSLQENEQTSSMSY